MNNFEMRSFEVSGPSGGFKERAESMQNLAAFWLLGLFNNSAYVIMIAGANSFSASAVGLVFLAAVLPGIILKATSPYWIHKFSYSTRIIACAAFMAASYATVALSSTRPLQLCGVVLASLQGSLGEASCLALASHYNSRSIITFWSSGTGFAGVFGYSWVNLLHIILKLSLHDTLMLAQITVVAFLASYFILLESPDARAKQVRQLFDNDEQLVLSAINELEGMGSGSLATITQLDNNEISEPDDEDDALLGEKRKNKRKNSDNLPRKVFQKSSKAARMSTKERFFRTLELWPYTVPLFIVYAAEYTMQAGVWASIGIPLVSDPASRQQFYSASNWCYQAGVFISRSSGTLWQAGRRALWIMPMVQVLLLLFFLLVASTHFWYDWGLLGPCVGAGLLGGAVYVNAFTLIAKEVEPQFREFSLGAASVADSLGIAVADVVAIFVQGCLFKVNKIPGADYSC